MAANANPHNPYLESLVIEAETIWPDDLKPADAADRQRLEGRLHAEPDKAEKLEYVRLYSGFSRRITVTAGDVARLTGA